MTAPLDALAEWAASVQDRYIDVDGFAGNQCWDAAQSWLFHLLGPSAVLYTQAQPTERYAGLAAGCWDTINADNWAGAALRSYLTAVPGDQPGMAGDVVICNYGSRYYPISHTYVLLEDQGANLLGMSQNSSPGRPDLPGYSSETTGPTIRQLLPREGTAGFLRPNIIAAESGSITPITEEDDMFTDADRGALTVLFNANDRILQILEAVDIRTGNESSGNLAQAAKLINTRVNQAVRPSPDGGKTPGKPYLIACQGDVDMILASGEDPGAIADALIGRLGADFAGQVVTAIGAKLSAAVVK